VRRYGSYRILDPGDSYLAIEKVGDVVLPPPTAQDKADLKELEGKAPDAPPGDAAPPPTAPAPAVQAYDPDLDAGTSPPPSGAVDSDSAKDNPHDDDDDDDSRFGATIEEVSPLDPHSQWLTLEFGYFNNDNNYFAGGGLRYGLSLGKMIFLRRAHLQDSLAIEAGAFLYKVINFKTQGDAYTIASLIGTARYNILFSENFGIFFYGGVMQNFVTDVVGGDPTTQAQLQSYLPAAGAGLMFRVGPSWEARVDLGYEMLGLGLILRF
jgi:hypothetical protein